MKLKTVAIALVLLVLSGCLATYGGKDPASAEGQLVSYRYTYEGDANRTTQAVYRKPIVRTQDKAVQDKQFPAVIVLHDGGGWSTERTRQYGDLFTQNGYATLEPRLFIDDKVPRNYMMDVASVYGALGDLASRPEIDKGRIYVLGMSAGAMTSMLAKTQMADAAYNKSGVHFKAFAALYPVCWIFLDTLEAKPPKFFASFTPKDMQAWLPAPIKIFIPEFDDYENKDSKVCSTFIDRIADTKARDSFSLVTYQGATHGWDHGRTYSFFTSAACKGKGCVNNNVSNPAVTKQGYQDVLNFLEANR